MELKFKLKKITNAYVELYSLTKKLRQIRNEIEEIKAELNNMPQLDECIVKINEQTAELEHSMEQIARLSFSLKEISEHYSRIEEKNYDNIGEEKNLIQSAVSIPLLLSKNTNKKDYNY